MGRIEGDADQRIRAGGAQRLDGAPVREQQGVRGAQGETEVVSTGCVLAVVVAEEGAAPRLIERDPVADAVADALADGLGVAGEGVGGGARRPAAQVLERLRQVPVIEGDPGFDARVEQVVDESLVPVQARGVGLALAIGEDARPGDREAVGGQAELAHEVDVFAPAVVVVAGDVAGVAVGDAARGYARTCPRSTGRDRPRRPRLQFDRPRLPHPRRSPGEIEFASSGLCSSVRIGRVRCARRGHGADRALSAWAGRRDPARLAHDQVRRQTHVVGLMVVGLFQPVQQQFGGGGAQLVQGLVDRRQRRGQDRGERKIVETDQRHIVGDAQAQLRGLRAAPPRPSHRSPAKMAVGCSGKREQRRASRRSRRTG